MGSSTFKLFLSIFILGIISCHCSSIYKVDFESNGDVVTSSVERETTPTVLETLRNEAIRGINKVTNKVENIAASVYRPILNAFGNRRVQSNNNQERLTPQGIPVATGGRHPPPDYEPEQSYFVIDFLPSGGFQIIPPTNNHNNNERPLNTHQSQPSFAQNPNYFSQPSPTTTYTTPTTPSTLISASVASNSEGVAVANTEKSGLLQVINGVKDFSLDLLSTFRALGERDNIFFSPVSIASLLSLLTLATTGLSRQEIEVALNIPERTHYHDVYRRILNIVNHNSEGVNITTSSRMYLDQTIVVKKNFLANASRYYNCSVSYVNYRSRPTQARNKINNWVETQTKGKITNFISSPIPASTRMILANTIYFSGAWKTPFSELLTSNSDFNTGAKTIRVPMMTNIFQAPHFYSKVLNVDILALPYLGDQFAMVVVLPRESPNVRSIDQVEMQLDSFYLDELMKNMTVKQVSVSLPKMKIEMSTHLKNNLNILSVSSIFSGLTADMSNLSDEKPLYVDQFIHKAVMEIDEKGTVAAAASAVMMDRIGGFPRVAVNKPAIIYITDLKTRLPLFWARVVEPTPLSRF